MLKNILHLFTISSLLLFASCKDSSTESETKEESITPPVTIQIETSISKNNSDTWAMTAKSLVESSANLYNLFVPIISESLPWKKSDNTWTYDLINGANSIKLQLVDLGTTYKFSYIINGNYEGKPVTNFILYETTYTKDKKSGEWVVNDLSANSVKHIEAKYIWSFSASNDFSGSMYSYNEAGEITEKMDSFVKVDKSGTFTMYSNNLKTAYYSWNVNGSGQVDYFESDGITIQSTHNWAANP